MLQNQAQMMFQRHEARASGISIPKQIHSRGYGHWSSFQTALQRTLLLRTSGQKKSFHSSSHVKTPTTEMRIWVSFVSYSKRIRSFTSTRTQGLRPTIREWKDRTSQTSLSSTRKEATKKHLRNNK